MGDAMIRRLVILVLAAFATVVSAAEAVEGAAGDEALEGLPHDEWQAVFMKGKRIGYVHTKMQREGDFVVSDVSMKMTMRRLGSETTVRMGSKYRERLDGTPDAFVTEMRTGAMKVRTEGTTQDGKLHLVTMVGNMRQERTVEWDPSAKFPYALDRELRSLKLEPGEELTAQVFSPEISTSEPVEMTMKVIGPDEVDVLGVKHEAVKVETRISKMPSLVQHSWLDAQGNVLATEVAQLGGVRAVRCTKAYALAEAEAVDLSDLMLITPDVPLEDVGKLTRLVVKLSTVDGTPFSVELPSEGHQRVVARDETSVTLEISDALIKTEEKDLGPFLSASTMVNGDDEQIIAAAEEAVGDETDPWRKAQALRRAVYELVKEKSFDVAMASATEVIRNKEGDCTEHAVLLAAMARAAGIPSRAAIGLMYVHGWFGYHMWTQVYVDGAWRDVDAVLDGRDFDPAHIRLATSPMSDDDFMFDLAAFVSVFGNLKIEIVEMDYGKPDRTD
jgi:hypothetical protein